MKSLGSLNDQLMEEMAGLLDAEDQLLGSLSELAEASQSPPLKRALDEHWQDTKDQADRLRDIFSNIQQKPREGVCRPIKKLIEESRHVISRHEQGPSLDVAIIGLAQRIEQFEIQGYKKAQEHAADLGHTRIVELMDRTLNEERAMHLRLSEMAQGCINAQALDPKAGGFYIPEGKFVRKSTLRKSRSAEVSRYIAEGNPNVQDQ